MVDVKTCHESQKETRKPSKDLTIIFAVESLTDKTNITQPFNLCFIYQSKLLPLRKCSYRMQITTALAKKNTYKHGTVATTTFQMDQTPNVATIISNE